MGEMKHALSVVSRPTAPGGVDAYLNVYCPCGWADPNPWHGIAYAAESYKKHLPLPPHRFATTRASDLWDEAVCTVCMVPAVEAAAAGCPGSPPDLPDDEAWEDEHGALHCGHCGANQAEWESNPADDDQAICDTGGTP